MYDIFLSYASQDRERVQPLYEYLTNQGWTVFWDHLSIRAGTNWRDKIVKELNASPCIIVIWSKHSVDSKFVRGEATIAQKRKVLVPIALDNVHPPLGFDELHTISFKSLTHKPNSFEFKNLQASVNRLTSPRQQPSTNKNKKDKYKFLGSILLVIIDLLRKLIRRNLTIDQSRDQAQPSAESLSSSPINSIENTKNFQAANLLLYLHPYLG